MLVYQRVAPLSTMIFGWCKTPSKPKKETPWWFGGSKEHVTSHDQQIYRELNHIYNGLIFKYKGFHGISPSKYGGNLVGHGWAKNMFRKQQHWRTDQQMCGESYCNDGDRNQLYHSQIWEYPHEHTGVWPIFDTWAKPQWVYHKHSLGFRVSL